MILPFQSFIPQRCLRKKKLTKDHKYLSNKKLIRQTREFNNSRERTHMICNWTYIYMIFSEQIKYNKNKMLECSTTTPPKNEFDRSKHITYLKRGLTLLSRQYVSNDTNRYDL